MPWENVCLRAACTMGRSVVPGGELGREVWNPLENLTKSSALPLRTMCMCVHPRLFHSFGGFTGP